MCTLILKKPTVPGHPLLIFGNRDERLDREAAPFSRIMLDKTVAWAPKDLEKGGTWLGINEHGLFAGLTNRYALHGYPNSDLSASRGELPHLALRHATPQDAVRAIEAVIKERAYPGFHLVLATYESALCLVWDGESSKTQPIETSTFIVTERSFGETPPGREVLIREKVSALGNHPGLEELSEVLATHQDNSIDAVCVHLDGINYGTRSAVCINLMPSFGQSQLWETNVPPCRPKWTELSLR